MSTVDPAMVGRPDAVEHSQMHRRPRGAAAERQPTNSNARLTALVAVRDPGEGKTRLSPLLSRDERAEVTRAMVRDVITALADTGIPDLLVVAKGARAARFAQGLGLPVLRDRSSRAGLNAALEDALQAIGPTHTALVVCADLPGLHAADVSKVLAADSDVVVAPTRDGGTGGLLLRPGARIELAYGRGSAAAHRRHSVRAGFTMAEVVSDGFHHDVDEPTHLFEVVARWPESHTARTVKRWGAK